MKTLGEAIREFFSREGLAARGGKVDLEAAWRQAAGEATAARTTLGVVKRGVLCIGVDSAPLLHELNSFQKKQLTEAMRALCPKAGIVELRFSVRTK